MNYKSLSSKLIPKIKIKSKNSEENLSQSLSTPSPLGPSSLSPSPELGTRKRSISDLLLLRKTPRNSFDGMSLDDLGKKKI
jgi:hypothetical protein